MSATRLMDPAKLKSRLSQAAFVFRGYNVTNLGRSRELLLHPRYGPIVHTYLREASRVCAEITRRRSDLVHRVCRGRETTLRSYEEAIALVVAMELAQLRLLDDFFGISYRSAKLAFGYSLGEITALVAGSVFQMQEAIKIPLSLARDCVKLAADVTLGVLFSTEAKLPLDEIRRQCLLVNREGCGVIGISTYLSPNSVLLMGQRDTLDRFKRRLDAATNHRIHVRKNEHRWPPLHTPIMWGRNIPNRSAMLMHTVQGGLTRPVPTVLSLVTGKASYTEVNARDLLYQWTDHPQRLWDVIYEALAQGVETIIHVGPEPNLVPATLQRLSDNVVAQTNGNIGMRALCAVASRPWLKAILPERAALLRAPNVRQMILEDWLLDHERNGN